MAWALREVASNKATRGLAVTNSEDSTKGLCMRKTHAQPFSMNPLPWTPTGSRLRYAMLRQFRASHQYRVRC